ncbi:SSB (plasmid) [Gluconacetobacter diazotrophicus PA1 5]|uniref:Single-stranded DNA-binding protein n=2 Tax=Gluconacetobacter diazotrophicus TaxID=33996 RepID=A9HT87_GLUDA|nr:SSB [Gluconacetobacter diazotrophicus PA1 5]
MNMSSVHVIVGHVGQDAEIVELGNGRKKATISVADTNTWPGEGGQWNEHTTWHKVVTFQKGLVEKLEKAGGKGRLVLINGRLQCRTYEKEGRTIQVWETIVENGGELRFLDSAKS